MVDDVAAAERGEVVAVAVGKGILKRRVTNEKNKATGDDAVAQQVIDGGSGCESRATAPRRSVTFDETILVKNDCDSAVVQRPLKLELVIEHWKSADRCTETAPRSTVGVVRRLVDEFNTIEHKASKSAGSRSSTLPGRTQNSGKVNDLINMFNSKSKTDKTDGKTIDF